MSDQTSTGSQFQYDPHSLYAQMEPLAIITALLRNPNATSFSERSSILSLEGTQEGIPRASVPLRSALSLMRSASASPARA